jgi:carbonic anhydrase
MPTSSVLAGIDQFRGYFEENREQLERLALEGQHPQVLFISCIDSRVAPELITRANVGDLLVVRSMGNIVPPYATGEVGIGAVIEYAVFHLRLKHIVVCGHTHCGCIEALETSPDWRRESHIARWIEHARPARTKVEASGLPSEERHLATVRENVLLQLEHLRTYGPVHEAERAGTLTLHCWVYHLETGLFEAYSPETRSWLALATS